MDHLPSRLGRFRQAIELLCGEPPPADLAAAWLDPEPLTDPDSIELQDWASARARLPWLMGITICEAAEAMADEPSEDLIGRIEQQYKAEHGHKPPYLWWNA
jgi:hypothetical protein